MSTANFLLLLSLLAPADHPLAAEGKTSLTNPAVEYTLPDGHAVVLNRGPVTAIVVDNSEVNTAEVPGHKRRYNGLAVLKHERQPRNLFVPSYAGLNYEHIHDGVTAHIEREKFEPREFPMQLRVVDEHTVELYQAPTPIHKLESCGRYSILPDGTIEYTFECIPHANSFANGYIGLFWASYINAPEDKAIHFQGRPAGADGPGNWIRAVTPKHGVQSTHPPAGMLPELKHDDDFPLTLVFNRSPYVYTQPWYYAVSGEMAYAQMFRQRDGIWLAQSPSGGGNGNPAWDFQWFIPDYEVGQAYGFTMRAGYFPFSDRAQLEADTLEHRQALNPSATGARR